MNSDGIWSTENDKILRLTSFPPSQPRRSQNTLVMCTTTFERKTYKSHKVC